MNHKLLLLDLDETLIHSSSSKLDSDEHFKIGQYYVYKRPYLNWCLEEISNHYKIGIGSAADDNYVEEIANKIIPKSIELEILWSKNWCRKTQDTNSDEIFYEKNLEKLSLLNIDLKHIILIDDNQKIADLNKKNTIQIKPFKGDEMDIELKNIYQQLLAINQSENIDLLLKPI